jgi:prolyl-tRNA synthetase
VNCNSWENQLASMAAGSKASAGNSDTSRDAASWESSSARPFTPVEQQPDSDAEQLTDDDEQLPWLNWHDDRDERPGVKFKDSELVGFPVRVGIGEKSLAKGEVEVKVRGGALVPAKAEDASAKVLELLAR